MRFSACGTASPSACLRAEGERAVVFENEVIVRSGKGHDMEVHIDTDEANAIAMGGTADDGGPALTGCG